MVESGQPPITPRFRVYGDVAEFETERHLEWFFCHRVLAEMRLELLKNQHSCREGVCDILAKGANNELVIIELKNTLDSHVIEQITAYFDALLDEKPFSDRVDYNQAIALYTICPNYSDRTPLVLKYHKLDFTLFSYTVSCQEQGFRFTLFRWPEHQEVLQVDIAAATAITPSRDLPTPPKAFVDLLGQCSDFEKSWAMQTRDQIYEFAQTFNLNISEKPAGRSTRFERTKSYPIAELDWDSKRGQLAIFLWLPFTTINGRWNLQGVRAENYKKTAMMRLWLVDGVVTELAYVENGRKSWLIVTSDEIETGKIPVPTKLQKYRSPFITKPSDNRYWKGMAMPVQFYLDTMRLSDRDHSLKAFVELALEHSLQRLQKSRSSSRQPSQSA